MLPLPSTEPAAAAVAAPESAYPARVPLWQAGAVQAGALLAVLALTTVVPAAVAVNTDAMTWALLQGIVAAALARVLGVDTWWLPIHALFVPGLVWALGFGLPPVYALAAFCLLASLYWGVSRTRVPLFLTSRVAAQAVAELLPQGRSFSFLDLGCGPGGVLASLARARPAGRYHGIESAPLPFLLARLRAALTARSCRVSWGDFCDLDLGQYDVVYAYLSPAAMAELWHKARREMRCGSLLISNSFAIPGVPPAQSVEAGGSRLLLWRM
ncbi:MAG: class I SAM-dependent methyltransferase [Burkholderiales bacterium]|nr:class I SAM-dependent methyltransferase [Burkholderiales bacterium]